MYSAKRRYHLLIYERMINRWWPATLALSLALTVLWWSVSRKILPSNYWRADGLFLLAGFSFLVTLVLFVMKKAAYVRLYKDHLRLVTPFLRLNISYKRFRRTTTSAMYVLFPPENLSPLKREIIEPLAGKTAVVIELNGFPTSLSTLQMFLSPFFFRDKSPHLVILVQDWMEFSTKMDSLRSGGAQVRPQKAKPPSSILARLPQKRD